MYQTKLLPLELAYDFHKFISPALNEADFEAKPMVMLIGQYSTGKTSFIKSDPPTLEKVSALKHIL